VDIYGWQQAAKLSLNNNGAHIYIYIKAHTFGNIWKVLVCVKNEYGEEDELCLLFVIVFILQADRPT
jgi:hypothetical protein